MRRARSDIIQQAELKRIKAEKAVKEAEKRAAADEAKQRKRMQQDRKAEFEREQAAADYEAFQYQKEQLLELYDLIEKQMNGNISESQKISYTRQLMSIDNKMQSLYKKIAKADYARNKAD